ncbi:MAG: lipid-A-disaccharide synthase [Acidobacteriota bacterium]|nr:MAG: lipid-A-disaccharide synthase [Acidobacteriota bacterium]
MEKPADIMIVAGEASGDAHAAKLVTALRSSYQGEITFFGSAGPKMREAGVEAIVEADGLSIVGLPEIAVALPTFIAAFRKLKLATKNRKPDIAVLVDFPEFNLKLARALKKQGIAVVYYICPQLWAWRKYRKSTIKRYVDLLISILPFEKEWFHRQGIENVEYVGNPLTREVHADVTRNEFRSEFGISQDSKLIALLPGSRSAEVKRILPVLSACASLIKNGSPDTVFVIALPGKQKTPDQGFTATDSGIKWVFGRTYDVLNAADAAAVTSGTATLEAGMIGTPMAVVYKTSALNYKLLRPLIDVEHFGLINLVAGKRVAREMIQDELTPEDLAKELQRLLVPETNRKMRRDLAEAVEKLGHGGASKRAAEAIIRLLESRG